MAMLPRGEALCVDAELSASSARSGAGEEAQNARLNARGAGWSPAVESMSSSWLEVDLGARYLLTGVATQGSDVDACWTTSYVVSHSADGAAWTMYEENAALGERTFSANTDQRTVEVREFGKPFACRYVRVHPKAWRERAALRVEVYGAPASHAPEEGVVYALESRSARGLFLHADAATPGAAVALCADGAARAAELTFSRASDGVEGASVWRASVAGAGLGVAGSASGADGAAITAGARNPTPWIVSDAGDGWVRLIAQESTGSMCVGGGGGGADAGAAVLVSMSPSIIKSSAAHWRLRRIDALRRCAAEAEAERAAAAAARAAEAELALATTGESKLGIADGAFALSASSERDERAAARGARLHQRDAAWSPRDDAVSGSWLEIDLGEARRVSGIATQGCSGGSAGPAAAAGGAPCWTTSYAVSHSADGVAWAAYEENAALGERTFSANVDARSVAIRAFRAPFTSRYVRVHPKSWRGRATLRVELYGPAAPAAAPATEEDEWRELTRLATRIAYFYCVLVPRSQCADRLGKARSAFQTAAKYLHVEEHLQVALRVKYGVEYAKELPAGWTPPVEVAEALARAQRAHAALTRRVSYFFLESLGGAAAAAAAAERAPLFLRAANASAIAAKWAYIESELCDRLESKYGVAVLDASEIPAAWRAPSAASLRLAAAEAEDRVGDPFGADGDGAARGDRDDGAAPLCGEIDPAAKVAWKAPEDINLQLTKILADIARGSARASALLV